MFNLIKRNIVSETSDGVNISYLLNDSKHFFLTSYKILQSQESRGFVKCVKLTYNGKPKLLYLSSNYQSLQSLLTSLDADRFVTVLSNLLGAVLELKDNGFLQCPNIDISIDKIFVNQNTLNVYLIYVPVNMGYSDADTTAFEKVLRTGLANMIKAVPSIISPRALKLQTALLNPALGLKELWEIVNGESTASSRLKQFSDELPPAGSESLPMRRQPRFTLTAIGSPHITSFKIDKPEYMIGKNPETADGVISYSTAVSRVHCKIIFKDGRYFVVDLGSANGSFVNNNRIAANTPTLLNSGDVLKLANCEFAVSN